MILRKHIRVLAISQIAAGVLLPVWWLLIGLALPVDQVARNFDLLIANDNRIPINIIGFVACLFWLVSLPALFAGLESPIGGQGFWGLVLAVIGVALFCCIQYYETFLSPLVVRTNPELLKLDGPLVFGSWLAFAPMIVAGMILAGGYLLLGLALFRDELFSRVAIVLLVVGVVVFANGVLIPIRTAGLALFSVAMVWIGVLVYRGERG